jgi:hypothetical protein
MDNETMEEILKPIDRYKIKIVLALLMILFSFCDLYSQNIPFLTNAIEVSPASFENVVRGFNKLGYKIALADKQKQVVKTEFKVYPGTICHISINVVVKDSSAFITGKWWSEIAPPEGSNNIMIVCHADSQIDSLFQELRKYAKTLKGSRMSYSITERNKLF